MLTDEEKAILIDIGKDWHSGQFSPLYALGCGDFSFQTMQESIGELEILDRLELEDCDFSEAIEILKREAIDLLCPICGENQPVIGITKDGRKIRACGDTHMPEKS